MGLCVNESSKRKKAYKTIIIPKGIIDPSTTNVIEIPLNCETNSNLVVKAPTDSNSCFTVEPYRDERSLNAAPRETQEFPQPRLQFSSTPMHDFSVQTQPIESPRLRRKAHSPLCPICARPSCKFGLDSYQSKRAYASSSSHLDYLVDSKSDTFYRSSGNREDELSRIVEEKLESILKPIVMQLTLSILEEEERGGSFRRQRFESTPSQLYGNNSRSYPFPRPPYKGYSQTRQHYDNSSFEYPESRQSNTSRFRSDNSTNPAVNFNDSHRSKKSVKTTENNNFKNVDSTSNIMRHNSTESFSEITNRD